MYDLEIDTMPPQTRPQPLPACPKANQNTGDSQGESPASNLQPKARVLLSSSGGQAYYGLPLLSVCAQEQQHTHVHTRYTEHLSAWELHAVFKQIIKAEVRGS
ncbi:hypothetical protein AMECASPLE_000091 [Ameca splendens]|uniref:Uncharacterized protein n=1 Tax=Ameca splendens TaxID=208324 RepID=A0ABV0YKV7_9TELE